MQFPTKHSEEEGRDGGGKRLLLFSFRQTPNEEEMNLKSIKCAGHDSLRGAASSQSRERGENAPVKLKDISLNEPYTLP